MEGRKMKKKWNRLRKMNIMESLFKKEKPQLGEWHKEKIQEHANFIAEGGILTFRDRRKK